MKHGLERTALGALPALLDAARAPARVIGALARDGALVATAQVGCETIVPLVGSPLAALVEAPDAAASVRAALGRLDGGGVSATASAPRRTTAPVPPVQIPSAARTADAPPVEAVRAAWNAPPIEDEPRKLAEVLRRHGVTATASAVAAESTSRGSAPLPLPSPAHRPLPLPAPTTSLAPLASRAMGGDHALSRPIVDAPAVAPAALLRWALGLPIPGSPPDSNEPAEAPRAAVEPASSAPLPVRAQKPPSTIPVPVTSPRSTTAEPAPPPPPAGLAGLVAWWDRAREAPVAAPPVARPLEPARAPAAFSAGEPETPTTENLGRGLERVLLRELRRHGIPLPSEEDPA